MYSRHQHKRSRSPDQKIKLHVSNLPVEFPRGQLITLFSNYGHVGNVRIIRNGPKGFPLKHNCYAFVEMETLTEAQKAVEDLNTRGWDVSLSKDSKFELAHPAEIIWPGFLTRCNSFRVSVNAKIVKGNAYGFFKRQYTIDISHRARVSDMPNSPPKLLITLEAAKEDDKPIFMEHIHYFQRKERIGIASIEGETLFIIPPGEKAEGIYEKMRLDQMIGQMWGDKEKGIQQRGIQDANELFRPENTFVIAPAP
ncbi:unnamed protein product [Blepharisma stoltei]|uniref:RRM domain-containing protein n=1 Tax=Blepharisma stoltei TaxID=1481888 RepID=A0AAU9JDP3_9CILI|nr:unnamed protein product [Blepharisma stoltei]